MSAAPPDITIDHSSVWAQANSADDLPTWAPRAAGWPGATAGSPVAC